MTEGERLLIGGFSALIPMLCGFAILDAKTLTADFAWLTLAGYVVKVLILFALGAFFAYIHRDERNRLKLMQLGMGVPALVVGVLNGQVANQTTKSAVAPPFSLVAEAYAQTGTSVAKPLELEDDKPLPSFLRGITGQPRKHAWFVIAGAAPTSAEAQQIADKLNAAQPHWKASVYQPLPGESSYTVVVGHDMKRGDAETRAKQAQNLTGKPPVLWSPLYK